MYFWFCVIVAFLIWLRRSRGQTLFATSSLSSKLNYNTKEEIWRMFGDFFGMSVFLMIITEMEFEDFWYVFGTHIFQRISGFSELGGEVCPSFSFQRREIARIYYRERG